MYQRRQLLGLVSTIAVVLLGSSLVWPATTPVQAQGPLQVTNSCVPPVVSAAPTPTTGTLPQAARLSVQQKQVLCQAADYLERQNQALNLDLASALLPGTLGPVGPLAVTDVMAHLTNPDTGSQFDLTLAAVASGLSGSVLLNGALIGYLRALNEDSTESNFNDVPQPSPPPFVFPAMSPETTPPIAATMQALLVNESQAVGTSYSLLHALRRARGAAAAGNAAAQNQQLRAAGLSAAQLAMLLNQETRYRLDVQGAMTTAGLQVILGDPALVGALQNAANTLAQYAAAQGVSLPVPPPPVPPTVPVALPPPPPPPAPPPPPPGAPPPPPPPGAPPPTPEPSGS